MALLSLVWAGAAFFTCKELIRFVVASPRLDDANTRSQIAEEPEPNAAADGDGQVPVTLEVDDAGDLAIEAADRSLGLSLGTLALAGVGFVIPFVRLFSFPMLFVGVLPHLKRSARTLWHERRLSFEGLVTFDIAAHTLLNSPALAASSWLFFAAGSRLQLATRRLKTQPLQPPKRVEVVAWRVESGSEVEVPLLEIRTGDLLVVRTGDRIPVDARLVSGTLGVSLASCTREYGVGEFVHAWSVVLSGEATVRALASGPEALASLAVRTREVTRTGRADFECESSVRPCLAVAGAGLLAHGPLGFVAGVWINVFANTLFCFGYSVVNTMAAEGASFRLYDVRALEGLSTIHAVVLERSTLTRDAFEVVEVHPASGRSARDVLELASSLCVYREHPLANAIVDAAGRGCGDFAFETGVCDLGLGMQAQYRGRKLQLASTRELLDRGIVLPTRAQAIADGSYLCMHVTHGTDYCGTIELAPQLRPGALDLVRALRARKVDVVMLSPDDVRATRMLAEKLGIRDDVPNIGGARAAEVVRWLKQTGRQVCYVGDGRANAPASWYADIEVCLGEPTVHPSAGIVIPSGSLFKLLALFEVADDFAEDQDVIATSGRVVTALGASAIVFGAFGPISLALASIIGYTISLGTASMPLVRDYSRRAIGVPVPTPA